MFLLDFVPGAVEDLPAGMCCSHVARPVQRLEGAELALCIRPGLPHAVELRDCRRGSGEGRLELVPLRGASYSSPAGDAGAALPRHVVVPADMVRGDLELVHQVLDERHSAVDRFLLEDPCAHDLPRAELDPDRVAVLADPEERVMCALEIPAAVPGVLCGGRVVIGVDRAVEVHEVIGGGLPVRGVEVLDLIGCGRSVRARVMDHNVFDLVLPLRDVVALEARVFPNDRDSRRFAPVSGDP